MTVSESKKIAAWLAEAGLLGLRTEASLAEAFCKRCVEAGIPLGKVVIVIDTLHPLHESRVYTWDTDPEIGFHADDFGPNEPGGGDAWQRSPFLHLIKRHETMMRCRIHAGETGGFEAVEDLRDAGQTDYLAFVYRLNSATQVKDVDAFYARYSTAHPGGFSDDDVASLKELTPMLGLAIRSASQSQLAHTLVEAYLGRDPGKRVLRGRIKRGEVDRINAVLWFSDMTGFTRLSETVDSNQLIPLLNDYAEAVICAVQAADGDVIKLIGDGILAIFGGRHPSLACRAALQAERDLRQRLRKLAAERSARKLPIADIYLGLHIGDVFYGNIGSPDRLDFTVVGPAVNETNRISSMCQSVGRNMLVSSEFRDLLPAMDQHALVSVGRFALKGVGRAQELFTLDPGLDEQ